MHRIATTDRPTISFAHLSSRAWSLSRNWLTACSLPLIHFIQARKHVCPNVSRVCRHQQEHREKAHGAKGRVPVAWVSNDRLSTVHHDPAASNTASAGQAVERGRAASPQTAGHFGWCNIPWAAVPVGLGHCTRCAAGNGDKSSSALAVGAAIAAEAARAAGCTFYHLCLPAVSGAAPEGREMAQYQPAVLDCCRQGM